MLKSVLKNSINHRMHLVAYNKEEIKQLGTCVLKVNYGGKTLPQEFFVVSSKFKPIIGLNASRNLGLFSINCPTYQSWTRDAPIDASQVLMLKLMFLKRSPKNGLSTTPSTNTSLEVLEGLDVNQHQ